MKITVKHNRTKADATERAKKMLTKLKAEHASRVKDIKENWNGSDGDYSCKYMGMKFAAHIAVKDNEVTVDAKIPFLALPLSGVIKKSIQESIVKAMK